MKSRKADQGKPAFMQAVPVLAGLCMLVSGATALAASYTWTSTSGGNWGDDQATGWNTLDGTYPKTSGDFAVISQNIPSNQVLSINVPDAMVGSLTIGDSSGTSAWTLTNTASESLVFDGASGDAVLVSKGGANTFGLPVVLNDSLSLSNAAAVTLNGVVSGAAGITKTGVGTLTFQGTTNTFSGTFVMDGGNVVMGKASGVTSLAGDIVINAGTLNYNVTGAGSHQIADTASVTVSGGTFSSGAPSGGGNSETISNLIVSSGSVSFGSGSSNPTLTMNGTTLITGGSVTAGSRGNVISLGACSISQSGTVVVTANSGSGNSALRTDGMLTITQPSAGAYTPISLSNSQNTRTAQLTLNGNLAFVGDAGNSNSTTISASISGTGDDSLNRVVISQATTTFNISDGGADVDLLIQPGVVGSAAGKALAKTGQGTLAVSGSNTYSGATTVEAGRLLVNGVLTASPVTGNVGATLGGTGLVQKAVVVAGGTLAPGHADGGATCGQLVLGGNVTLTNAGSTNAVFKVKLGGTTAGSGYDQLVLTNTASVVNLSGVTLNVSLTGGFIPSSGSSFTVIRNDGVAAISGTFSGLPEGGKFSVDGRQFVITYAGNTGNSVVLTCQSTLGTLLSIR